MEAFLHIFQQKTGEHFSNGELAKKALTHDSCGPQGKDFERMEFLGDACLGLHVAEMLLQQTDFNEGEMHLLRSQLTRRQSLAAILRSWKVESFFILPGKQTRKNLPDKIYEDYFESLIGALHLDRGHKVTGRAIHTVFNPLLQNLLALDQPLSSPKTRLQEYLRSKGIALPHYEMIASEGPAHNPTYKVELRIDGLKTIQTKAKTIRDAEKSAAALALEALGI